MVKIDDDDTHKQRQRTEAHYRADKHRYTHTTSLLQPQEGSRF